MVKIDVHQHFWKYDPIDYRWIDDTMSTIRRDFFPDDLQREIAAAEVGGVISVQARQSVQETRWLLALATQHQFIRGVVGWAPLTDPNVQEVLVELAADPKLLGLRHVLQDEPDSSYILRDDFNRGICELKPLGLVYDILIFERHLPQTIQFVDKHPDQIFVVDHLAKPRVKDGQISPWRENILELARRPNVYCKISGLVTEADWSRWTVDDFRPYFQTALSAFEPRRLMFGSDWPVCLLAASYRRWVSIVERVVSGLSVSEQERIWSGTAVEAYGLK
jgi:L-fuconolactonase